MKMKKAMIALLAACAALALCLSARADHSVVRREGDIDMTRALDAAVALACEKLGLAESEIRGRWFYQADYYEKADWEENADGPVWYICLVDPDGPEVRREEAGQASFPGSGLFSGNDLLEFRRYDAVLRAGDGGAVRFEKKARYYSGEPLDWQNPMVPGKEQMQPQEALDRAYELLAEALGLPREDALRTFRDYKFLASGTPESGRFWYHIIVSSAGSLAENRFHVWLDPDSGETVRQTDPAMFAGRYDLWRRGISHYDWYMEQLAVREAEWGARETWDYRQHAAFEESCFGYPLAAVRPFYTLPGEGECTLEEAEAAALSRLKDQGEDASGAWTLAGSAFVDYFYDLEERMAAMDTNTERCWELTFVSGAGLTEKVVVDAATGRVADGPYG